MYTAQLCIAIDRGNEYKVNRLLKKKINFNCVHDVKYVDNSHIKTCEYNLLDHIKESTNSKIIEKMINTKKFDDVEILEFLNDINEQLEKDLNNGGDNFREEVKNILEKYIVKNTNIDPIKYTKEKNELGRIRKINYLCDTSYFIV